MSGSGGKEWAPPPKIEQLYAAAAGNKWAGMNKPTAGAQTQDPVPVGSAPFQLYSLATPNGGKIGILLEELAAADNKFAYDAYVYSIQEGMQFHKGFVDVNPNSKIPCGVDHKPANGGKEVRLFESASMMLYLADKHRRFVPPAEKVQERAECINWLFWQMAGQGPITGNFGHFMVYAPDDVNRDYAVTRYGMEVQRLCSVLENQLSDGRKYILGDEYSIADMAILPWFQAVKGGGYRHANGVQARGFLSIDQYTNACRWAEMLMARPQVKRGMIVCLGAQHDDKANLIGGAATGKPWLEVEKYKWLAKL